ncbi:xaa-Pro aminopeptidase 1-like isoform X2 [Babylonia areolata]|uniref:xaa-Pro aminopeptidase 1-like isoform X2 n=2 Tax=Babylonia areolata TaxID=304850 RepID=UPI003FCF932B
MPAKATGSLLSKLRALMKSCKHSTKPLQAYIIPTGDAHQSEYVAECDQRRAFITGFTGSAGTAVVTENLAALWTDGRYHLQAEAQLDGNWILMKEGLVETPTMAKWLNKELAVECMVGCDPTLVSRAVWKPLEKSLQSSGHSLQPVTENLVDLVWEDRPPPPSSTLMVLSKHYTGYSWQKKVELVQEKLKEKNAKAFIVTALDEVAWLLNLRGADIMYNPVFFSYAVITPTNVHLFIEESKLEEPVRQHLEVNGSGGPRVVTHPYSRIWDFLGSLVKSETGLIWVSDKSSFAISDIIPKDRRLLEPSPVAKMKCVKNAAEIEGMRLAQVQDAVALCEFMVWLEKEVPKGSVTEISAADKVEEFRRQQKDFVSLSFDTISSIGPNGAIIHYKPKPETDRQVTTDQIYLVDSGAQYRCGTTDTTRTLHLGTPSRYEQECFTRVLKGHINLCTAVFPSTVKGHMLDTLARTALWDVGLDYPHGTGHGVGAFLNVHEGPCGISSRVSLTDINLEEGMILSDEPGYYEDGKFGIRLENCVLVVKAQTQYKYKNKTFLTFEPITLVPIQTKLIDPTLLTEKEISWLNAYHTTVRTVVGKELQAQGKEEVHDWLVRHTEPLG